MQSKISSASPSGISDPLDPQNPKAVEGPTYAEETPTSVETGSKAPHMSIHADGRVLGPEGAEPLCTPSAPIEPFSNQLGNDRSFCEYPFPPDFISTDHLEEGGDPNKKGLNTCANAVPPSNKHKILDHLCKNGGLKIDILQLCKKYEIPLDGTGDNGNPNNKSEEDLKEDIEFHLELEQQSAWYATNQALEPICSPEARSILADPGISITSKSVALTNSDLMPISTGWGPSLSGMFADRFPG